MALEAVGPLKRVTTKPKHNAWLTKEMKELCDKRYLRKKEADLWGRIWSSRMKMTKRSQNLQS